MDKKYKFSLSLKLVLFTTVLATITYSTSAFFIYVIYDWLSEFMQVQEFVFTIITFLLGIIWTGILTFVAAGFITKPLHQLEKAASTAAEGHINEEIAITKSDDEIRSLGVAFETMLMNLREMVQNIENNFQDTNGSVTHIKQAVEQASQQAELIQSTIGEISQGAESTSISIQQTAELVEESTQLATQIQTQSQSSQQTSEDMLATVEQGRGIVLSLVDGIQSISKEQEISLEAVERLEGNANKVEDIISVVGDIASQTNLLALNASIEAARAGEQGKGFAVVAEEVRKLADESAKAVQGVSDLIENMQVDVRKVVGQIKEQVAKGHREADKGVHTNAAMDNMSRTINDMAQSVIEITTLVDNQLQLLQKTSAQAQEVSAIAQQTSAGTQQVNASMQQQNEQIHDIDDTAHALAEQADGLKQQINRFRTT
ncbi:methyl-accepting chemotaxis protein [Pontibacillus litoralis]|uniref:Methyl-accepting chemotaxis protein n=1 Tax=Pontibacillus litoralis JSM 072002 TaxID=1385512 RepID=A0A0A5G5M8_9BACI|nr:methyl-accepting chemotaxis protein [Pontibacillus litoralis]KGX86453.1 methyl-accepting chemotaxis protein [Pontibacillus litoralis JSM 072002]